MHLKRRILAFLLCVLLVLPMLPAVKAAGVEFPLSLSQVSLTDFDRGKVATAEIKVINHSKDFISGELILALYDASTNAMADYTTIQVGITPQSRQVAEGQLKIPYEGSYIMKAFVWDNMESMHLLSNLLPVQDPPQKIGTVTLSIERRTINKEDIIVPTPVDLLEGDTAWTLLQREMDSSDLIYNAPYVAVSDSVYIQSLEGDGEGDHGEASGWMFYINDKKPFAGLSKCALHSGDSLRLCYSVKEGTDVDHPLEIPSVAVTPDNWENDLWLSTDFHQMAVDDTYTITPYRMPEIPTDPSVSEIAIQPPMMYQVISGKNVVSVDNTGVVTALSEGVAVIQVSYTKLELQDSGLIYEPCAPVNYAYITVEVNNDPAPVEIYTDLNQFHPVKNVYHTKGTTYDTVYFTEGDSVPYPFTVSAKGCQLTVTCNGQLLIGANGSYTANLRNCTNIIQVTAEKDGKRTMQAYSIDARKVEMSIENATRPGASFIVGDEVAVCFKGLTMPVYKMDQVYIPNGGGQGTAAGIQYTLNDEYIYGRCNHLDLSRNNTLRYKFRDSGTFSFTDGCIDISWQGETLEAHRDKKDLPTLDSHIHTAKTSLLPSFTIQVTNGTDDERAAQEVDIQIDAIGTVTMDSESVLKEVRESYESLTDSQKELVTRLSDLEQAEKTLLQLKADIVDAGKVTKQIEEIGLVTLEKESQIRTARNAYNALTDAQKKLVTNLDVLEAAEAELQRLIDIKVAGDLDKRISEIGNVTLEKEQEILDIRLAYEALSSNQKNLIKNLETLEKAEVSIKMLNQDKADKIVDRISKIGEVTLKKEKDIIQLRKDYDALTSSQKVLVLNINVLEDAENELLRMNTEYAKAVDGLINKIGKVTLDSKQAITDAWRGYYALSETQKPLVTKYETLVAADARYKYLLEVAAADEVNDYIRNNIKPIEKVGLEHESVIRTAMNNYNALPDSQKVHIDPELLSILKKAEADLQALKDQQAAQAIVDLIEKLPAPEDEGFRSAVTSAKSAYDNLPDSQKQYVSNKNKLDEALKRLQEQDDIANAQLVAEKIDAIKSIDHTDPRYAAAVQAARDAYDALSFDAQTHVQNYQELLDAETKLDQGAADKVIELIRQIETHKGTPEYAGAVQAARDAYDKLTDAQKKLVSNKDKLLEAEQNKADQLEADKVIQLIEPLKNVSAESAEAIQTARKAYNALTDSQKKLVGEENLKILTDAEEKIQTMADHAAANNVDSLISTIGTVTMKSEPAVQEAKEAYNALTDDQKKLVTEYDTLEAAENKIAGFKDVIAANAVDTLIDAIGKVTPESRTDIRDARIAYSNLTETQKGLVKQLPVLEKAESKLNHLSADQVTLSVSLVENNFYHLIPQGMEVKSDLAESYGYTDKVKDGVSALDALVMVHEILYSNEFTPLNKDQYLSVDENGLVSTMMGKELNAPGDAGFTVDGMVANDGVVDEKTGRFTKLELNQARVLQGDSIAFFFCNSTDEVGDIYTNFFYGSTPTPELLLKKDVKSSVTIQGYHYAAEGCNPVINWKPLTGMQVCLLTIDGESKGTLLPIEGAVTDENGEINLTFTQTGIYYLAVIAPEESAESVIPQICKVTVKR